MIAYSIFDGILLKVSSSYQPLVAITLPIMLKINVKVIIKLVSTSSNGDQFQTNAVATFLMIMIHTSYMTIILSSITTFTTGFTLMAFKLVMDFFLCLQIIWNDMKTPNDSNLLMRLLLKLALNEISQFLCPLAFMLSFLIASNGKNAHLLGGVGSSMWQYEAAIDISKTLLKMAVYLLTDLCSTALCTILLWANCKINLFKTIFLILNEFGYAFVVIIGFMVSLVNILVLFANCFIFTKILPN